MSYRKLFFIIIILIWGCSKRGPENVANEYLDFCRKDDIPSMYKMLCEEDKNAVSLQEFLTLINEKKYDNYEASISGDYVFVDTLVDTINGTDFKVTKLVSLPGHDANVWTDDRLYFKGLEIAKVISQNDEYKIKLNLDKIDRHKSLREVIKKKLIDLTATSFKIPEYGRDRAYMDIKFSVANFNDYTLKNPVIRFYIESKKKVGEVEYLIDETLTLKGSIESQEEEYFWHKVYNRNKIFSVWFNYWPRTELVDAELDTRGEIELSKRLINETEILDITNYYDNIPVLMNLKEDIDLM